MGCVVGLTHSLIDSSIAAIHAVLMLINNHTATSVPATGPFVLGVGWVYPVILAGPGLS